MNISEILINSIKNVFKLSLPFLIYLIPLLLIIIVFKIFLPQIKGYIGEKKTLFILNGLNKDKYKIINDVYLKNGDKITQIDHIVVSKYGIFVIETKNYSGHIYGKRSDKNWTQVIYKNKEKFYNPIRQNYAHTQTIKELLKDLKPNNKVFPFIVFPVDSELKVSSCPDVIYGVNLNKNIRKYTKELFTDNEVDLIYNKIIDFSLKDEDIKKNHTNNIKISKEKKVIDIDNNICPKCGGKLLYRKGKYGDFKGCSNYPKCKFTNKL